MWYIEDQQIKVSMHVYRVIWQRAKYFTESMVHLLWGAFKEFATASNKKSITWKGKKNWNRFLWGYFDIKFLHCTGKDDLVTFVFAVYVVAYVTTGVAGSLKAVYSQIT